MRIPKILIDANENYIMMYMYDEDSQEKIGNDFELLYEFKAIILHSFGNMPINKDPIKINRGKLSEYECSNDVVNISGLTWTDLYEKMNNPFIKTKVNMDNYSNETTMYLIDDRSNIKLYIDNIDDYNLFRDTIQKCYANNKRVFITYSNIIIDMCKMNKLFDTNEHDKSIAANLERYIKLIEKMGDVEIQYSSISLFDTEGSISAPDFIDKYGLLMTMELDSFMSIVPEDEDDEIILNSILQILLSTHSFAFALSAKIIRDNKDKILKG